MIVRLLVVSLFFALLSGCGFQMRGQVTIPAAMKSTVVTGSASAELYRELKSRFQAVEASLQRDTGSGAKLNILEDRMGRRTLSVGNLGKALEYELYYIVQFEVSSASGQKLVSPQKLTLVRDYYYQANNVSASFGQEDVLRKEMYRDMSYSIMRRIQAQAR